MTDYYNRGIPIPETTNPGVIHHARLGSMEAGKIPKKVGQGYKAEHASTLSNVPWLKQISVFKLLSEIKN